MPLAVGRSPVTPLLPESPPAPQILRALAFFEEAYRTFERAEKSSADSVDWFFRIGGSSIHLRFATTALLPHVTRAFAHLSTAPVRAPNLTICLWDSESTNAAMPTPPWGRDAYLGGGEIRGFNSERLYVSFQLDSGILSLLDHQRGLGLYWVKAANQIPSYETAAPLRLVLYPWLETHGHVPVHAGAVGLNGHGVLLAGKGGSGKSSTAFACLAAGMQYVSDDFSLLRSTPRLTALSLYSTGKLYAKDLERLHPLGPIISNPEPAAGDKVIVFLNEHFSDQIAGELVVKAILIPRVGQSAITTVAAASPAAGLTALAPGTLLLLPSCAQRVFGMLARMVRLVPCFYLDLGNDPVEIANAIREFLSR